MSELFASGPIVNIPNEVRPDLCAYCRSDKLIPVEWATIPYASVIADCRCADCERSYVAIMTRSKSEQWDSILVSHFEAIEDALNE